MEIKVQIKHIVIPLIAITVTMIVLLFGVNIGSDKNLNVAFLFSGQDITEKTEQQIIWDSLNNVQQQYQTDADGETTISLEYNESNGGGDAEAKLSNYSSQNDVIVIYGDVYNNTLQKTISSNLTTYYILVDNSLETTSPNAIHVNVNEDELVTTAATKLATNTTTNNIVYMSEVKEAENQVNYSLFTKTVAEVNPNASVTYYYVEDSADSLKVKNDVLSIYESGSDSIYVENPNLNEIVIDTTVVQQQTIIEQQALASSTTVPTTTDSTSTTADTTSSNTEETTDTTSTTADTTSKTSEETAKEEPVSLLPTGNLNVAVNGYDDVEAGYYADTNLDGIIDMNDRSVVISDVVYDFDDIFKSIFVSILSGQFNNKEQNLTIDNGGLVVVQ